MTISTAPTPLSYDGDDSTVDFPITWKYISKAHVVATLRSSSGTETVWVLDTDYTLTDPADTGTLTATTAPATGETLVITLEPPNTQLSSFPLGGDFPSTTTEQALDLCAQRDGRLESLLDRAMLVPVTDSRTGSNITLPIDTDRASKFLAFDGDGDPIAAAGTSADLTPVSTYINTLLDDASAADARTTLGAGATGSTLFTAATAASARSTLSVPSTSEITGRNRLKNGSCRVSHRYGTTATSTADDTYMMDCWYGLSQTGACTHQQVAPTSTIPYWNLKITQAQASAQRFGVAQIIEGKDCTDLLGQDGVFSFNAYTSATATLRYAILEWTGTEDSVTSDVVNDWTSSTYTAGNFFNSTTLTVTAVGSQEVTATTDTAITALSGTLSTSLKNAILIVWTESTQAQNFTLQVGKLQFEPGTTATTFEHEAYSQTFEKCQRYFYGLKGARTIGSGVATAATTAFIVVNLPIAIRTALGITNSAIISAAADFSLIGAGGPVTATEVTAEATSDKDISSLYMVITTAGGLTADSPYILNMDSDGILFINSKM